MAKTKVDGVIEAVHYGQDGQVSWVRVYERRGPIFSDVVLIDRDALIDRIKSGKNYYGGQRVPLRASTFVLSHPFQLIQIDDKEFITSGNNQVDHDHLDDIPVI